jgi:hypothetical protein
MRDVSLKRKELYVLLVLGLFLVVFLQFALGVGGLAVVSSVALVSLLVLLFLLAGSVRWRLLSYSFFVWLLLEGAFRKWFFPGLSSYIFFVKHMILIGPYLYILSSGIRIPKRYYPFLGLLLLYVTWGVLEAFNFRVTTDFRVQALGLITHFWFIPLIFLVPAVFDTEERIIGFFRKMVYLSLPILILGIIQYFSPPFSPINQYAPNDAAGQVGIALVGVHARITGVFSYMTPYKAYLGVLTSVIIYLLVIRRIGGLGVLILCLGVINMIMIGSRGGVASLLINSMLFVFFYLSLRGKLRVKKKVFIKYGLVVVFLLVSVISFTNIGREAALSLIERTKSASGDVIPRIVFIYSPLRFLSDAGLVGYGIGTAYQGARAFVEDWGDMPREFEAEWERILLEFGLIGFVIVVLLRVSILLYTWKVFKRIKTFELKLLALMVFIHQLPVLYGLNIVFDYMNSIIYWSLLGLLISVSRLERNNAAKGPGIPTG